LKNSTKCLQAEQAQNKTTCPLFLRGRIAKNIFSNKHTQDLRVSATIYNKSAVVSIARHFQQMAPRNIDFLTIQDRSFPSLLRKKTRHPPWPISLTDLYHNFSSELKVRFVVLQRPFAKVVMSHSAWDGGIERHALKMAEYLEYIGNILYSIPRDHWRVLSVECLYKNEKTREKMLYRLMEFLDWRPDGKIECCGCLDNWRDSRKHNVKEQDLQKIELIQQENESKWGVLGHSGYVDNREQYFLSPDSCF